MSVESEILRIQHNIANAYAAVSENGGNVPLQPTSENLAAAIASIPSSGAGGIPAGGCIIWSGAADAIPDGWVLCDGNNGTYDLRDKFVLCAGTKHAVGETGGSEEVTLTVEQMPEHNHWSRISNGSGIGVLNIAARGNSSNWTKILDSENAGSSQPHPNMPPYYALCYIMKT